MSNKLLVVVLVAIGAFFFFSCNRYNTTGAKEPGHNNFYQTEDKKIIDVNSLKENGIHIEAYLSVNGKVKGGDYIVADGKKIFQKDLLAYQKKNAYYHRISTYTINNSKEIAGAIFGERLVRGKINIYSRTYAVTDYSFVKPRTYGVSDYYVQKGNEAELEICFIKTVMEMVDKYEPSVSLLNDAQESYDKLSQREKKKPAYMFSNVFKKIMAAIEMYNER
jgi:hypothetical protein